MKQIVNNIRYKTHGGLKINCLLYVIHRVGYIHVLTKLKTFLKNP